MVKIRDISDQRSMLEKLLRSAFSKQVSERLETVMSEFDQFTKDMSKDEAKEARLVILELIKKAFNDFYNKRKNYIER